MKVSSTAATVRHTPNSGYAAIEFADPLAGGNSSAGEKHGYTEKAARLSWWSADGKFDPISSAELPYWAMLDVVDSCANSDFFSIQDPACLIKALAASIERKQGI